MLAPLQCPVAVDALPQCETDSLLSIDADHMIGTDRVSQRWLGSLVARRRQC